MKEICNLHCCLFSNETFDEKKKKKKSDEIKAILNESTAGGDDNFRPQKTDEKLGQWVQQDLIVYTK